MNDPRPRKPSVPKPGQDKEDKNAAADTPVAGEVSDPNRLSAEEQMERFEKELKENDWGHQPC